MHPRRKYLGCIEKASTNLPGRSATNPARISASLSLRPQTNHRHAGVGSLRFCPLRFSPRRPYLLPYPECVSQSESRRHAPINEIHFYVFDGSIWWPQRHGIDAQTLPSGERSAASSRRGLRCGSQPPFSINVLLSIGFCGTAASDASVALHCISGQRCSQLLYLVAICEARRTLRLRRRLQCVPTFWVGGQTTVQGALTANIWVLLTSQPASLPTDKACHCQRHAACYALPLIPSAFFVPFVRMRLQAGGSQQKCSCTPILPCTCNN